MVREAGGRKARAPDCQGTSRERSVKVSLACRASRSGSRVPLVAFDGRRRRVQMDGACAGCHLSATTLWGWVAGTVRWALLDLERIELARRLDVPALLPARMISPGGG
jgi:Fe-S cluster biogenesis protein NfuA